MPLRLEQDSEPTSPPDGEVDVFFGTDGALKAKKSDGSLFALGAVSSRNLLVNGTFLFAQRQAPGTLTTYSNTSGRSYCADRWAITNENASAQFRRVDSIAAPETGLGARFYGEFKKITNAGKLIVSQVIEGSDVAAYRGRRVRVQFKAKNSVGSHTLRLALLYLTSAGTVDTIPATFVSAFGATSVDPTWGTNLSAIAPTHGSAFSSVSGAGLTSVLSSSFRQYGGVFVVPASAQNIVVVIFTDGQPAANAIIHLSEVGLFDGDEERAVLVTDFNDELARCQRFCLKTFALDTAPAQNVGAATGEFRFPASAASTTITRSTSFRYPVMMRAAPTVTTYSPGAASAEARDVNASANCTATSALNVSEGGLNIHTTGNVSTAVGNALGIHLLLEAEL